jgi:hypothetical protein
LQFMGLSGAPRSGPFRGRPDSTEILGRAENDPTAELWGTKLPESTLEKIGVQREKKDLSFIMANGTIVTRSVGFAIVHVERYFTIDEVVFAEKGDLVLLGARTLEGLNLTVDATKKKLVAAGPIPAA